MKSPGSQERNKSLPQSCKHLLLPLPLTGKETRPAAFRAFIDQRGKEVWEPEQRAAEPDSAGHQAELEGWGDVAQASALRGEVDVAGTPQGAGRSAAGWW